MKPPGALARARGAGWGTAVLVVAVALSLPPLRSVIEQSMLWHMAVQMPLLVAAGWLLAGPPRAPVPGARPAATALDRWDLFGLTRFMAALVIASHWMLPSAIDRAVVLPQADAFKLASLLLCGALLRRAMGRSPAALQLFFVGTTVSMLFAAGAHLATTEQRLCNAYALDGQWNAGLGLMAWGAALATTWLWASFGRRWQQAPPMP